MKNVIDLHKIGEDERVRLIGNAAMMGKRVAVLLETAALEPGKIERYIQKVEQGYPRVTVVERARSPVCNVDTVVFGLRTAQ